MLTQSERIAFGFSSTDVRPSKTNSGNYTFMVRTYRHHSLDSGAKFVRVTRNNVQISLIPLSPLTGDAWGFLYDPKRAYLTEGWPDHIRATWYRDFYEFSVRGE